jgi:hypothetical protein
MPYAPKVEATGNNNNNNNNNNKHTAGSEISFVLQGDVKLSLCIHW